MVDKELITTKKQLKEWLRMYSVYYYTQTQSFWKRLKYNLLAHPCMDQRYTWKYIKTLRRCEYHINNSGIVHMFLRILYLWQLRRLSYKTAIQIPPNAVGPGLNLPHFGAINMNENSKVGRNATIYSGVRLGWKKRGLPCPCIGDNVFIGNGTNIIGDVHIGDNVTIGQNCVIVKDIKSGTTVVAQQPRILEK